LTKLEESMMKDGEDSGDEESIQATLDDCFPITATTGEEKDKQVAEISHLKYIPTHMENKDVYLQVYQGRLGRDSKLVDLLNPSWVRWVFDQDYCYYVMRLGIAQWKKYGGDKTKMKWVPVPAGSVNEGVRIDELLIKTVILKYPQYEDETCTFHAFASALHYCAATLKMGDKSTASFFSRGAVGYAKGQNARDQLDFIMKEMKSRQKYFNKIEFRYKKKAIDNWDILHKQHPGPTVIVVGGADGGQNHSVTLVNDLVFDSNCYHAMRLSEETLDWCCNCKGGFERAVLAVRFSHH
jgi:hypothetical protein